MFAALWVLALGLSENTAANRDFVSYWAAGRLVAQDHNPFDPASVLRLQQAVGWQDPAPAMMRNTPLLLPLVVPLGWMSVKAAGIVWCLLIAGSLMASIRCLRSLRDGRTNRLALLAYCFPPAMACIFAGQTSMLLLLGLSLFLLLHSSKPALAGLGLALCCLKPHLFLPFACVVFLWIVYRRTYRVLWGVMAGTGGLALCATVLDPKVWTQYAAMLRSEHIEAKFIPNASLLFRLALDQNAIWLQFVPTILGCFWAMWYFRRHRRKWDWTKHGSVLLLISIFAAPYSWFTDEVVVLPAMLESFYGADKAGRSLLAFGALAAIAILLVFYGVPLYSPFYIWTPAAWLLWYLFATRPRKRAAPAAALQEPAATERAC